MTQLCSSKLPFTHGILISSRKLTYHQQCIKNWVETYKKNCPLCRKFDPDIFDQVKKYMKLLQISHIGLQVITFITMAIGISEPLVFSQYSWLPEPPPHLPTRDIYYDRSTFPTFTNFLTGVTYYDCGFGPNLTVFMSFIQSLRCSSYWKYANYTSYVSYFVFSINHVWISMILSEINFLMIKYCRSLLTLDLGMGTGTTIMLASIYLGPLMMWVIIIELLFILLFMIHNYYLPGMSNFLTGLIVLLVSNNIMRHIKLFVSKLYQGFV